MNRCSMIFRICSKSAKFREVSIQIGKTTRNSLEQLQEGPQSQISLIKLGQQKGLTNSFQNAFRILSHSSASARRSFNIVVLTV